ncbi:hypothetical protein [Neobacillus citreus]|uniref:Uncharacterized protein n=1 Tax=Neobacillus citreus TaxID=2833578 RepID=A0A942T8F6_9BACI|nr:hypothetical protein [Neobacillus citreus]MCH6266992.1 hypothetical protein [Neobacillus citreus]
MDFQKLRTEAANFLKENKQRIQDNPHSIDYVLKKFDGYLDIFRNEIKESFPMEESLISEIEQKLPRPKIGEIEQFENVGKIKDRLISISTRLENEIIEYERIIKNSPWGPELSDFNKYRSKALDILRNEKEFLLDGTYLEPMIDTINQEHRSIAYGGSTRALKSAYQRIRSSAVIDEFKRREEEKIFSKVDETINAYSKYLSEYLKIYQEHYERYSDRFCSKQDTLLKVEMKGTPDFVIDDGFESKENIEEREVMVQDSRLETVSMLDEGLEEVGVFESKIASKKELNAIKTVTITYTDGYSITLDIPVGSREKLKAELAKLVF